MAPVKAPEQDMEIPTTRPRQPVAIAMCSTPTMSTITT